MLIEIPYKTPTINHLYWHRGNIKIMKKEAKELREKIIKLLPINEFTEADKLEVEVYIFENWFTKQNEVKKKDIMNREKFLLDSVFEGLELDDKMIFKISMSKINGNEEKTIIRIKKINEIAFNLV